MMLSLYCTKRSPPSRAAMLTARALDLQLDLKQLDLSKKEHRTPEYLKMNPMHTVPTLNDNGFVVVDSHAICGYLVNQYGKDDSLYPRDAEKRAIVDQRLHFDSGTLFARLRHMVLPIFRKKLKTIPDEDKESIRESYDFLEKLLGDNQWVAGDKMTIADFSIVTTITSLDLMVSGLDKHPKVQAWINRCKTTMVGYEEVNEVGLEMLKTFFNSKLQSD